MAKKNKKKTKQGAKSQKQNQISSELPKPSLNITLANEIDYELLSKWPKLRTKVPSIYLHHPAGFYTHINKVVSMDIKFLPYHVYSNYDKITCVTLNDHKMLTQYFKKQQLPYHTYGHPSNRKLKVVIKGLPLDINLNTLKKDLCSLSIPVIRMHKMHTNDLGKARRLLVLAVVPYDNDGKNILKLKTVSGKVVKLEPPNLKSIQCFRCQKWGHSQRYCHGQIKCVKCGGEHFYTKCERDPEKEDPKCANCGDRHTANYKECPFCPDSVKFKDSKILKEIRYKMSRERILALCTS